MSIGRSAAAITVSVIVGLFMCSLLFFPELAFARDGLVTCTGVGEHADSNPEAIACGTCEFVSTMQNVFNFLLLIATIVATAAIVYAGLRLVTSGGSTEARDFVKRVLTNIALGFTFVIAAFAIVNTVITILVPSGPDESPVRSWNTIQCLHATIPTERASSDLSDGAGDDDPVGGAGDDTLSNAFFENQGVCSEEVLSRYFGPVAGQAACIIKEESVCGAALASTVDVLSSDGRAFSWGAMQINLTWNHLIGCTGDYNPSGAPMICTDAFNGRNYSAVVIDEDLYERCVDAALDMDCNLRNGDRLHRESGNSWRLWSTAGECGLR